MTRPGPAGRAAGTPAGRPAGSASAGGTARTPGGPAAAGPPAEAAAPDAPATSAAARRGGAPWWLVALVGVLALVGLVGSAVLLSRPDDAALRASAVEAAERYTALLTSYDAATLEEDVARVRAVSTDGFAEEYAETIEGLRDQITGGSTISVGTVVAAGLESVADDRATVLVAVDQSLTTAGQGVRTEANRVRMTLVREDGSWRIAEVERL